MAAKENKNGKNRLMALARPHIMLALSMIFLVVVSYTVLRLILPDHQGIEINIFSEEITEYLSAEIDENTLIESIDPASYDLYNKDDPYINISDEDIINYLIEEGCNYEEILKNF